MNTKQKFLCINPTPIAIGVGMIILKTRPGFSPVSTGIMSHVKIWIHTVWGTKNHERVLTKDVRQQLFQHVRENAKEKQIYIDFINGDLDHIHCLLALFDHHG